MYSGLTLTRYSGCLLGAHQRLDRVAYKVLRRQLGPNQFFPDIKSILHFEGVNGPDGIKRKSPGTDEPRHFYNPFDDTDTVVADQIKSHYENLVKELRNHNMERSAFEASWLAHAIVDGLTPAHHYPYDEEVAKIRGNSKKAKTVKTKLMVEGDSSYEVLTKNWKLWGAKGLLLSHGTFEFGVATIILPARLYEKRPDEALLAELHEFGFLEVFERTAREIAKLNMYTRYMDKGWTSKLTSEVRHELIPRIVQNLVMAWYAAVTEAETEQQLFNKVPV